MATRWSVSSGRSVRGGRGVSSVVSAVVVVVVLAGVGVGTYAVMGGFSPVTPKTCEPLASPICGNFVNTHDVTLLLPFKSVQQGSGVPFTVSLPAGESATAYTVYFGDGTSNTGTSSLISHNYTTPGTYLVRATAQVNGQPHDNVGSLILLSVTPSFAANQIGAVPSVSGSIVGNSSVPAGTAITAVLQPGQFVTLSGSYTGQPTNPAFVALPPRMVVTSGGSLNTVVNTNSSLTTTATFASAGTYQVTFVGSATNGTIGTGGNVTGGVTLFMNYTWTVFVSATGEHAGIQGTLVHHSPHPGTIINYVLAPGGALSEDPAIDYETVGAEPIINVYQPLITYNGSLTGPEPTNYVPVLATCVPGSAQCSRMYGSSLVDGWNYTFVIQGNASFYDPLTQAHWGVWPTDVVFSMARTLGFSTLPSTESNNGWIIAQSLLDSGNVTWDSIHASFNNTPRDVLDSMTINETTLPGGGTGPCPQAAITGADHGCVTFHAYGQKHLWPYFLELIADPLGGSIVPCGWFSAPNQAAGIPYWTRGNVSGSGDQPCGAPGSPGWGQAPDSIPYEGWDQWEQLGSGAFGSYLGHVQFNMVGSGPYYMSQYLIGSSYSMMANPAYGANPYCTWKGCPPASHNFAHEVDVTWENSPTQGETAYLQGVADHASIPSTDFSLLLELISQGKAVAINAPTLTIGFEPFDLNFNLPGAQRLTTQPLSVPTDWFSYVGMRQFFATSYPYETVQNTINTRDGVVLGFGYGGAIPQYMANYYPKDIAWPNTDPCSDSSNPSCPVYWWKAMQDKTSPYFDPQMVGCTASNPCQLPLIGSTGSPAGDEINQLWTTQLSLQSGGGVKVQPVDLNFVQIVIDSEFCGPGQCPMPFYGLGWAPDYPDPTDYVNPLYQANNTYTFGDSVMQSLLVPQFTNGCGHSTTDYNYFANNSVGNICQGQAYKAMLTALNFAATEPVLSYRALLYDLAEKIAAKLCLYTYTAQSNQISSVASWMDASSINTNVTIGGGGDVPYFWLTGNDVQYPGST